MRTLGVTSRALGGSPQFVVRLDEAAVRKLVYQVMVTPQEVMRRGRQAAGGLPSRARSGRRCHTVRVARARTGVFFFFFFLARGPGRGGGLGLMGSWETLADLVGLVAGIPNTTERAGRSDGGVTVILQRAREPEIAVVWGCFLVCQRGEMALRGRPEKPNHFLSRPT